MMVSLPLAADAAAQLDSCRAAVGSAAAKIIITRSLHYYYSISKKKNKLLRTTHIYITIIITIK